MPELAPITLFLLFTAALGGGFIDSIAGGGGLITVPALLAAGVPPHLALGTNKLQASFGSFTAAWRYRRGGMFRLRDLRLGIACTAMGAVAGTVTIQLMAADLLTRLIPILLVVIFVYMLANPSLGKGARSQRIAPAGFYVLFGSLIGFYDGFFGPGTGSFWVVAFVIWMGFDLRMATGHTKMLNFTSNFVSLATFLMAGHVMIVAGLLMGLGQIAGAWLGSHIVLRRGTGFVRVLFLVVVAATIAKLLWDTYLA
jgi:uncharacterized membrane protein YfcA